MIARTLWSAKTDRRSDESTQEPAGDEAGGGPLDDLLEARFDEAGRLAQAGRGSRQLTAERLDPSSSPMSADELERAVQKLAQGLEAIDRQGSASPEMRETESLPGGTARSVARQNERGREFVASSLDRLEARLEALSRRLKERAGAEPRAVDPAVISPSEPSLAGPPIATPAEVLPHAEARDPEGWQSEPTLAASPTKPDVAEPLSPGHQGDAERGLHDMELAAVEPRAPQAAATMGALDRPEAGEKVGRPAAELQSDAQLSRTEHGPDTEAASHLAVALGAELVGAAEADTAAGRRVEATEAEHRGALAASGQDAVAIAAEGVRQFAALQSRIETLQASLDANQIEPVRREMLELLRQLQDVGRDGRAIAGAVADVRSKLDDMEVKLNAARNMTANRLSDFGDRLSGLTQRVGGMEAEVPGFDAVRENQAAILERFDLMQGLVHRLASPEELLDRIEAIRRQLQTLAPQREVARIEDGILKLAGRLDALPEELSDSAMLARIEGQLADLASELGTARGEQIHEAADLDRRLADLAAGIKAVADADTAPDMSGLEERLADIFTRLDDDRRFSGDALGRLAARLAELTAAVETEEDDAASEILAGLTGKIDTLAQAIEAQDAGGARRDLEGLSHRIDQLSQALAGQAEHLSRPQSGPLEERLDAMQAHLEELGRRANDSTVQFGPFAEKLQEIADRVGGLGGDDAENPLSLRLGAIEERLAGLAGRGSDTRALHTQLEGIVSRLELLKGRSIDPARLAKLFDRVDAPLRAGLTDERLDRLERKLDEAAVPAERLDRLERRIVETARAPLPEAAFGLIERTIAESLREGFSDERLATIQQKLAGAQVDFPDERFQRLEQKLEEIGRASVDSGDFLTPDDFADLRTDIIALRRELRSLPGLGDGEANLSGVLKAISERLERMPEDPPASAAELEVQIERIAQLLENPDNSRLALAHIEDSLRTIETSLDETRRTPTSDPAQGGGGGQDEIQTVVGLARALSDDVSVLRGAAEVTERRTKDALEAVQGTLEAVVKRMAFLEREADAVPFATGEGTAEPTRLPVLPASGAAGETARLVVEAADPPSPPAETAREPSSGGLFSRFTSSQLLKRATGGRAESFSPHLDDGDDAADQPLEPGTDTPLNSALIGAPSSNTALMSGARRKGRAADAANDAGEAAPGTRRIIAAPEGEDFLAAARRAAQAAATEAAEAEREAEMSRGGLSRALNLVRTRRRVILASALALAVSVAAVQLIRKEVAPNGIEIAGISGRPATTGSVSQGAPTADADVSGLDPISPAPAISPAVPAPAPEPLTPPRTEESSAASAAPPSVAPVPAPAPPPVELSGPEGDLAAGVLTEPGADLSGADLSGAAPPATGRSVQTASLPPAGSALESAPSVAAPEPAPPPSAALTPAASDPVPVPAPAPAPTAQSAPAGAAIPTSVTDAVGPEPLRTAALAGDPAAAFEVASRLADGQGAPQDLPAAVAWYRSAAEAGLAPAAYRLGSIYEKGLGVAKDLPAAMDWYGRAAEAGNVKAMHNLAVLYAEGAGGEPDLERAARLFRQAGEHGVRDSQFNLAILHARGLGVPQDMVEAYKWFAVAAGSGDAEALKRRDIIAAALPQADLAKAQAAAAAYQPSPLSSEANDVTMPEAGWGESATNVKTPSEGDQVALVQRLLADKGFDPGPADGVLGQKTVEAITLFQDEAGLPANGTIDTALIAALQETSAVAGSAPGS